MIAVGTDIVEIERVEETLDRLGDRFARRILTPDEFRAFQQAKHPARLLAKRFAAKEAVAKTLGTGIGRGVSWQDIHLGHDEAGAPTVVLTSGALAVARERGGERVLLSVADERHYVVAFATLCA